MEGDGDLTTLGDNAKYLGEDVYDLAAAKRKCMDKLNEQESESRAKIVQLMQDVRQEIAKKEADLFNRNQAEYSRCRAELQACVNESDELARQLGALSISIDQSRAAGNYNDAAGMKQGFEALESKYFNINDRKICPMFQVIQDDVAKLGNLKFGDFDYESNFVSNEPAVPLEYSEAPPGYDEVVEPFQATEFSTQTDSDRRDTFLTSILWTNGKIIVTDKTNKKVKVFRATGGRFLSELRFPEEPYGICSVAQPTIDHNAFAVVTPKAKKIFFINLTPVETHPPYVELEVNTHVGYSGISTAGRVLVATAVNIDYPRVDILDKQGGVLRSMAMDVNKSLLFQFPRYIATDGLVCVVSDWRGNNLTFLRHQDCAILGRYKGSDALKLMDPYGVTVDGKGYIYVMDGKTGHTHVIDRSFNLVRVIEETGSLISPRLLAYEPRTDTLAVTFGGGYVKYFPVTSAVPNYSETSRNSVVPSAPMNSNSLGVPMPDPQMRCPSPGF